MNCCSENFWPDREECGKAIEPVEGGKCSKSFYDPITVIKIETALTPVYKIFH
jgi:hypothetical protein